MLIKKMDSSSFLDFIIVSSIAGKANAAAKKAIGLPFCKAGIVGGEMELDKAKVES